MAVEERAISDFPRALEVLSTALVLISNPDGQGGFDSLAAGLTELGKAILNINYTQELGNVSVFDAIKNVRVLSGTTTPTALQGADNQLYIKYETVSNIDTVTAMYIKLNGTWCEISVGGGGDVGIECTQAQYDAWEQAGTLLADTNYYITDGQSGGGVVIDDTTASLTTVYSSDKVEDLLSDKQDKIPDTVAKTVTFDVTPSGGEVKAKLYNRVLYVSGYFRFSANQSANTQLLHISDVTLAMEVFESSYTDGSSTVRFKLTTDGKLINENQFQANQWVSVSLACLLA